MKIKKGEISSSTIVAMLIAITGFIILIYFLSQINKTVDTDFEVCHLSVEKRSAFNLGPFEPGREYVPLKCNIQKLCLKEKGSKTDCIDQGIVSTKSNKVKDIKISKDVVQNKGDVISTFADSLYRCQSMLGKGNLNFMPTSDSTENYCIICSRIGFNEELKSDDNLNFTYEELYLYLQDREVPGKDISYLEYLYQAKKLEDINQYLNEAGEKITGRDKFDSNIIRDFKISPNSDSGYAIVAQMNKKSNNWVLAGSTSLGGLIFYGLTFVPGVGVVVPLVGGITAGSWNFYTFDNTGEFVYGNPRVVPYNSNSLNDLGCTVIEGTP